MAAARSFFTGVLPYLIFAPLALAGFYLVIIQTTTNGLGETTGAQCNPVPLAMVYTGIEGLDAFICAIVGTFQAAFTPNAFTGYFIIQISPILFFIYLESTRRAAGITRYPLVFTVSMQLLSFAATFSFYWAPFISQFHLESAKGLSQSEADSAVFGNLLGYVIPSFFLVYILEPWIIAAWQLVPLSVALIAFLAGFMPSNGGSGYGTVKSYCFALFAMCAALHLRILLPMVLESDVEGLKGFFIPGPMSQSIESGTSLEQLALTVLQWDFVFGVGSSIFALVWIVGSAVGGALILLTTIAFGPGAAVAGFTLWREGMIEKETTKEKSKSE